MKMTSADYAYLKAAVEVIKDQIPSHIEFLNRPENKVKIKDFDTRLIWDVFHVAMRGRTTFLNKLYDYLNDEHINTAMKAIMTELRLTTSA